MDFEKNEKKLGISGAENTLEPTTDAHENDESDGIYVIWKPFLKRAKEKSHPMN